MIGDAAGLTERLRELVDDDLRVVATYAGTDRALHYVRADVEPKADPERIDRIHEELVLGAIDARYQEQLFELGRLRAVVRHFEEGVVLQVAGEAYTGVLVSIDTEAVDQSPAVIDACRAYLRSPSDDDHPLVRGPG